MMNKITKIFLLAFALAGPAPAGIVTFPLCYDYDCENRTNITLTFAQWQSVRSLFLPPAVTPLEERRWIAQAIARLESLAGAQSGTSADLGGNARGAGDPGQMDCIDESTNTTTYLRMLRDEGLFRWHAVQDRRMRNKWFFDVHWTAVIVDNTTGREFAVDSWFFDNGREPVITPFEDWLSKRGDPEY